MSGHRLGCIKVLNPVSHQGRSSCACLIVAFCDAVGFPDLLSGFYSLSSLVNYTVHVLSKRYTRSHIHVSPHKISSCLFIVFIPARDPS